MPLPTPLTAVDELERLAARTWRGLEEQRVRRLGAPGRRWVHRSGELGARRRRTARAAARRRHHRHPLVRRPRTRAPGPGALAGRGGAPMRPSTRRGGSAPRTTWSSSRPVAEWAAPRVPVDLAADARRRVAVRLPLPRHAAAPGGAGGPAGRRRPGVRLRAPLDPAPSPLAAVARGALADGWLCVTAVTVDDGHRRQGLATAVMAALGTWARDRGAESCVLQVASSNAARWPSTGGSASPSTTATTTDWVPRAARA